MDGPATGGIRSLVCAPILGYPTESGRFVLDTDVSLFAVGGVLSQLQNDREVVIAYTSCSLCLSQWRYCTTRREMLAAVVMCTHFRSYLRGAQFTLHTDHSSLRWLQRFRNRDSMQAGWYLLLGQFSVTFEYRPGAQHVNADGMSRQCGQCQRTDCPVSAMDSPAPDAEQETELVDQPFAASEILWMQTYCRSCPAKLRCSWIQSESTLIWAECAGLSPELRCWRLQVGNLSIDIEGRLWRRRALPSEGSQLVVPQSEWREMIRRLHDSCLPAI